MGILFHVGVTSDTYVGDILQCNTNSINLRKTLFQHLSCLFVFFPLDALLVKVLVDVRKHRNYSLFFCKLLMFSGKLAKTRSYQKYQYLYVKYIKYKAHSDTLKYIFFYFVVNYFSYFSILFNLFYKQMTCPVEGHLEIKTN